MEPTLREDCDRIVSESIAAVLPDRAVVRALQSVSLTGRIRLISVGKAAWQMANAACGCLGTRIERGVVVTKYGHVRGPLSRCECFEAGHPIPDENGVLATQAALDAVRGLTADDTVLFLLSGGGSALFEKPLLPLEQLRDVTEQLLRRGADIGEINTVRKRFSAVKGGRFAQQCAPARLLTIALSDVLDDAPDQIASGPTCADPTTSTQAVAIAAKYTLTLTDKAEELLRLETPKRLPDSMFLTTGSVRELCAAAMDAAARAGYIPFLLTDRLCCEAREAGRMLAVILRTHALDGKNLAFIAGGETVVHVTGQGKGGRNQELALAAADGLDGLSHAAVFSIGSDGTDGPTDAAGGFADGDTLTRLRSAGLTLSDVLADNDAYHALKKTDGLIMTGPTGTNVNDVAVALIRASSSAAER
ncbi:MAG: glycerate kinase [Eubacteriales bacterium]|nr:glycerate kinase [Eubacteriales bacterium]